MASSIVFAGAQPDSSSADKQPSALTALKYTVSVLAGPFDHPWSVAALPDGRYLITERSGHLRVVDGNDISNPVGNVPPVYAQSQAGLFDVVLHPDYAQNGWIYLSFAHGTAKANATRLIRARLKGDALIDIEELFTARPFKNTPAHFGGRLVFLPDNTLLLTIGDGFDYREQAQNLGSHLGKIVRINDDGSVPEDNPFFGIEAMLPEIWSYGHRNAQAIVLDEETGHVYANEHGPAGGDEVNRITVRSNYGWPITTHGRDYSGAAISPFTHHAGIQPPLLHWTPSIAPAGMALATHPAYPSVKGDLLIAALKAREVRRIRLRDGKVVAQQSLFTELGQRIRDIRTMADGSWLLLTDSSNGQLLRVILQP